MEISSISRGGHDYAGLVRQKRTKLFIGLLSLACLLSVLGVFSPSRVSAAPLDRTGAYNTMNNTLPDDGYDLCAGSTCSPSVTPTQCTDLSSGPPKYHWGCTTDNYAYFPTDDGRSHQYITLGKKSVNDDNSPTRSYSAKTIELKIYSLTKTAKNIRIKVVDRGIGPSLACGNKLNAYYYNSRTYLANPSSPVSITTDRGCDKNYDLPVNFPASNFQILRQNNQDTNIYVGYIVIAFDDTNCNNCQTSFHVSTTSEAKLGYYGDIDAPTLSASNSRDHTYVNVYPTNLARDHRVRFFFRPPCDVKQKGLSDFSITWDDVNTGQNDGNGIPIQPTAGQAEIYRFRPGDIGSRQSVQVINNLGTTTEGRTIRFDASTAQDTDGFYGTNNDQPYAYMVEFRNIYGGNGITFQYPWDSADSRIPCPEGDSAGIKVACSQQIRFDIPPRGVNIRVYAMKSNYTGTGDPFSSTYGSLVYDQDRSQGGVGSIDLDVTPGYNSLLSNQGFRVLVKPLDSSGNPTGPNDEGGPNSANRNIWTGECFHATCTIEMIMPVPSAAEDGWPYGAVKAGSTFSAIATIYNNDTNRSIPASIGSSTLGLTDLSGSMLSGHRPLGQAIGPGGNGDIVVNLTAPTALQNFSLEGYPDFWGKFGIGPACTTPGLPRSETGSTYQEFNITPSGQQPTADVENPDIINWKTGGTRVLGPYDITAGASSTLVRRPVAGGAITLQSVNETVLSYGTQSFDHVFNDAIDGRDYGGGVWQPGDRYCTSITINPGHGWAGAPPPSGPQNLLSTSPVTPANEGCGTVQNRPYLRAYGADVSAGGGFGTACNVNAGIEGFTRPTSELGTKSGSGTQLAALASGNINGFMSASMRSAAPAAPMGLSFANTVNNGPGGADSMRQQMGGAFGSYTDRCATDFWNTGQLSATDPRRLPAGGGVDARTALNVASDLPNDKQTISRPGGSGQLTLGGGNFAGRHALFVDGDVFINGNIAYQGSANPVWTDLNSMTNFSLVVKGNIYISQNVSRLDGLYVAQPLDNGTKGTIYTCTSASDGSRFADTQLWSQCQSQLRVFGSFVANQIRFLRTPYTLSESAAREPAQTSKAAEIFQVSPDSYLSQPVFRPRGSAITGEYDYIATLPPVL